MRPTRANSQQALWLLVLAAFVPPFRFQSSKVSTLPEASTLRCRSLGFNESLHFNWILAERWAETSEETSWRPVGDQLEANLLSSRQGNAGLSFKGRVAGTGSLPRTAGRLLPLQCFSSIPSSLPRLLSPPPPPLLETLVWRGPWRRSWSAGRWGINQRLSQ